MKVSDLDPREIKYIRTLDWDLLIIYLEKKFGKELKDEFVCTVINNMQKGIDGADKKWVN